MDSNRLKKDLYAFGIIAGNIIGVGFFSLPYIAMKVGVPVMLGFFLFLGIFGLAEHMLFTEVALHTPDHKRLPGFAKFYLGKWGGYFANSITIFISVFGVLVYYIIGSSFLRLLVAPWFQASELFFLLIYAVGIATLVFFDVKMVSRVAIFMVGSILTIFGIIVLNAWPHFNVSNLAIQTGTLPDMFLPYGAILFALWGVVMIPEAEEFLEENRSDLRYIVPLSVLVPFLLYMAFTFFVLGVTGEGTTESALAGLQGYLTPAMYMLALSMGVISTFNACSCTTMTLRKILNYDLKVNNTLAWFVACFVPLGLYFLGATSFLGIVTFAGAVFMGLEGILVLILYEKLRPQTFNAWPMMIIFISGIVGEIILFLNLL